MNKTVKVSELIPYFNNPRINAGAVEAVKESIKQCGYIAPIIVDKEMVLLAGHTRLEAIKKLGWSEVEVKVVDGLTEEQKKKYRILDNKTAEFAEWDMEKLQEELDGLDFGDFDFGFEFEEDEPEDAEEDDFEVNVPEEPKSKRGDIYQLGRHRLMCGDSTSVDDIDKLMNGQKADMTFTDPPYNIDYSGIKDERKIKNDKMSDDDFLDFLQSSIMKLDTAYVCCSWQYAHIFKKAMENIGMPPKAMIVWDKVNPAQNLDKYYKQHEIIWYHGKFGGEKTLRGDIWECKRQKNTIHPTMKPLELIGMALNDNKDKNIVYDGFGGSGSTLMACEQAGKTCYTMEIDEHYCDVIIERWEQYTGKKAVLLER